MFSTKNAKNKESVEKLAVAQEFGATDGILATDPKPWKAARKAAGRAADAVWELKALGDVVSGSAADASVSLVPPAPNTASTATAPSRSISTTIHRPCTSTGPAS